VGLGSGQSILRTVAQAEKVSPVNSRACALSARLMGPFLFGRGKRVIVRKRICRVRTPDQGGPMLLRSASEYSQLFFTLQLHFGSGVIT
jgi:hypothetical protein